MKVLFIIFLIKKDFPSIYTLSLVNFFFFSKASIRNSSAVTVNLGYAQKSLADKDKTHDEKAAALRVLMSMTKLHVHAAGIRLEDSDRQFETLLTTVRDHFHNLTTLIHRAMETNYDGFIAEGAAQRMRRLPGPAGRGNLKSRAYPGTKDGAITLGSGRGI